MYQSSLSIERSVPVLKSTYSRLPYAVNCLICVTVDCADRVPGEVLKQCRAKPLPSVKPI